MPVVRKNPIRVGATVDGIIIPVCIYEINPFVIWPDAHVVGSSYTPDID